VHPLHGVNHVFRYVRADPKGVWGAQQPNGSWTGMFKHMIDGNVDASVAGFGVSKDRSEVVDFPAFRVKSQLGVFVRRPKAGDISIQAYLSEFSTTAWFSVAVYLACVFLALFAIMKQTQNGKKTMVEIWAGALNITFR
jgi:hypothetical protein